MKQSTAASSNGASGEQHHVFRLSPATLVRVLHTSFFLLGMGLMAPLTAILQTMDYLNNFFAQFYPSRTLYTGYNTTNLVALVILFKLGERIWPNKRSRLITGYSLYTVILIMLPVMDYVLLDHIQQFKAINPTGALQLAFSVWAVGACVAGVADALISTVAYSQAAAIGQRYTHAFVGGRATSGLVMAALRCVSKGALQQNMAGLRQSTSIYVMIAALIALTAVMIAGVLLPKLGPQIEQLKASQASAATQEAVDEVEDEKCEFCRMGGQSFSPLSPSATMPLSPSSAANFSQGDQLIKPHKSLPIPPVGPIPSDGRISTWGYMAPLLNQQGSLVPQPSAEQLIRHSMQGSRSSCPGSRLGSHCGRQSLWGGRLSVQGSLELQEQRHKAGLMHILDAALPAAAEESGDSVSSHASSSSSFVRQAQQFSIAEESQEGSQPPSPPASSPDSDVVLGAGPVFHSCSTPIAEDASEGSSQPSSPPASSIDADVVVLTGKPAKGDSLGGKVQTIELTDSKPPLIKGPHSDVLRPKKVLLGGHDSPTAAGKDQHMVVYLQGYMAAAHNIASELQHHHHHCTCQKPPRSKAVEVSADSSSDSSSDVVGDSWSSLFKIVWPFCLAVQPAPMTTATILPLNLSSQVGQWPVVTASRWHVQIMMVVVQLGFFLGSAILPIRTPRRPRVTLLLLACLIFLFGPAFALALVLHGQPYVFLIMAFAMHTYSGYMTSTVFCVANQGFASKDAVRVQQLLVLSMGVSYVIGSCISWLWVLIGRP